MWTPLNILGNLVENFHSLRKIRDGTAIPVPFTNWVVGHFNFGALVINAAWQLDTFTQLMNVTR